MTRTIWTVSGNDRFEFLQNLVTNDLRALTQGDGIVWAALLTPQGKYLADFFVVMRQDDLLIDIATTIAEPTLRRLSMYRLRADVRIDPSPRTVSRGTGAAPEGSLPDPRHPAMGWRSYDGAPEGAVDWDALRVEHIVPETGIELTPDTFILEAGFERLHGVDFRKGCYVGQEVTARMKHKTELRKGLVRVRIGGAVPPGTPVMAGDREAGTLFTQSGGRAIAHMRFDRMDTDLRASNAIISPDKD